MRVVKRNGSSEPFSVEKIDRLTDYATQGLCVDADELRRETKFMLYDGISTADIFKAQVSAAASLISIKSPDYTFVAARLLLSDLYKRTTGEPSYRPLSVVIAEGIEQSRLDPRLGSTFDLEVLSNAIRPERDFLFKYDGLQAIIDRYLLRTFDNRIIELPQDTFMRVAMGLALLEDSPTDRAIEFYNAISSFDLMSSTPSLFNSGLVRSQLSSCYLNLVADQISSDGDVEDRFASIFGTIEESARLSKYAGGIGTSWTNVRGSGSLIRGTNGRSSGVIPYMRIWNDTAVAVNQGGKRKGSFAAYLEPWHPDFWDFCEVKKEFGEERLRCRDVYPAAWLPDLFMERVSENGVWSVFDPSEHPELHDLHGDAFKARYLELEGKGLAKSSRPAMEVWRHIITNLFETGHPWITFKDECNRRSPQQHVGVVHSSNLCTEITLNTSDTETAVCNLASVNLAKHMDQGRIDTAKLRRTARTAIRMLDNVIDLNFYPSPRAKLSNEKHRPVGLGVMGYSEALVMSGIAWDAEAHLAWADEVFEAWSFYAIEASADLATERGAYPSFDGSLWSKGILPIHTARSVVDTHRSHSLDWTALAAKCAKGMRNSNCMAIAPTATISTITGTTPGIEPTFDTVVVEHNISGDFKVVDPCLRHGPLSLCKTAWEIPPKMIIKAAAVRQKWIDQSQSVNIFVERGTTGKDLSELYMYAWRCGLKTTYYLRSRSRQVATSLVREAAVCSIDNPNCESCQ